MHRLYAEEAEVVSPRVSPARTRAAEQASSGRFVKALGAGAERPAVRVLDRAWLDDKLALHVDLESAFVRDDLREAARDYRAELAFDRLDLHWSINVAYRNGAVVKTLRPKHPRAHQASPICFAVRGRLKDADPGLAAAVRRVVGFGTAEELVLPACLIQELSVHGPEWLHIDGENAEVRMTPLSPAPGQGQTVELVFYDGFGGV
ncbi:hypothetical protein [Streptomyces sp. NPDC058157]|uniref:hypothetical protein n=1 Tax=Streptomyces sp. NPDC058157 TaxID=3346360 RepID=UPI0036EA4222